MLNLNVVKSISALMCFLAVSQTTFAGHEINGGYGLKDTNTGKIVSLDLAMRGVEKRPYAPKKSSFPVSKKDSDIVDHLLLPHVASSSVTMIIKTKLAELAAKTKSAKIDYPLNLWLETATQYSWIIVTERSCLDVKDDNSPYPNKVQLAYRTGRSIRFCQGYEKLDDANKAALIMHEIIYAAHKEKSMTVELVGFLFSEEFHIFDKSAQTEANALLSRLKSSLSQPDRDLTAKDFFGRIYLNSDGKRFEFTKQKDAAGDTFSYSYVCTFEGYAGACTWEYSKEDNSIMVWMNGGRDVWEIEAGGKILHDGYVTLVRQ